MPATGFGRRGGAPLGKLVPSIEFGNVSSVVSLATTDYLLGLATANGSANGSTLVSATAGGMVVLQAAGAGAIAAAAGAVGQIVTAAAAPASVECSSSAVALIVLTAGATGQIAFIVDGGGLSVAAVSADLQVVINATAMAEMVSPLSDVNVTVMAFSRDTHFEVVERQLLERGFIRSTSGAGTGKLLKIRALTRLTNLRGR